MRIVIIEDEKNTAEDLSNTIKNIEPKAEVIAILNSVEESLIFFHLNKDIDLIFSDIELTDGLSFDVFDKTPLSIPIIFCTAYNEYALKAFNTFGIDYILKPFSKESVAKSIGKFRSLSAKSKISDNHNYKILLEEVKQKLYPQNLNSILVYKSDKVIPIETDRIALFFIENTIVYAYTFEQLKLNTSYKLDYLEHKLYPQFFRANRQFLINKKSVKEASQHFHRKLQVNFNIPFTDTVLIGKEKVTAF
jgi:two-component system response regulator LytT